MSDPIVMGYFVPKRVVSTKDFVGAKIIEREYVRGYFVPKKDFARGFDIGAKIIEREYVRNMEPVDIRVAEDETASGIIIEFVYDSRRKKISYDEAIEFYNSRLGEIGV
ncbi:hypothetical protein GWN42_31205 [candidate division KSB1 bacterium]|nr:hypothetical protein [Phycisphaerae bacterium]NIQ92527.1 hypothetical protein [Deltaproteobacteria bacterium]NIV97137.1 hypothetical protein [candidate division KSB1 bacterium]